MQKNFKLKTVLFPAACFCAAALIVGCANGSDSSSGLHLVSLPSGVTTQLPASSGNNPFLTTGIFYETSSDAANPDSANSIHFTSDSEAVYYSYGSQYEKVAYAYDTTSNKLYGKPVAFYDEDSSSWTSLEDYVEGWAEVAAYFGSPMTTEEKNELYTALQIVHSFDYTIAADVLTTTGIYLTGLPW
ncbi:MAG: hypothetical protein LKF96_06745 [Treponema sp.]|jgi:hypothetical protein|nr:hypothetical protein [Treponema sp.]